MRRKRHKLSGIVLLIVVLTSLTDVHALALGATPISDKAEAELLYEPLAKKLSQVLKQDVTYIHSENWLAFSKSVLASNFDIVISEPHIIAYVTSKTSVLSMNVIARFPGTLGFHIITHKEANMKDLNGLRSKRICMLPSPSFSGVLMMKKFANNPVTQPTVHEVRGTYDDVYQAFVKRRCAAALVNTETFQRHSSQDESLIPIYQTPLSPNVAVAVSKRIPQADRKAIKEVLLDASALSDSKTLFETFSKGLMPFEEAKDSQYKAMNILPGVVWGW